MRFRGALIALLVAAACGSTGVAAAAPAQASSTVTIPVVSCPTWFGLEPSPVRPSSTVTLRGVPASTGQLVAYTNTSGDLIAPPGMRCSGLVGADGNSTIQVWPPGQARPRLHGPGAGLSLALIPACVGCKAQATCHYFPTFRRSVRQTTLNCRPEPPPGERLRYLSKRLVAFVDPPYVRGAGWPSGAGQQATGLVGIEPGVSKVVFTSSCTLPIAQRSECVASDAAERSLYSAPGSTSA